MSMRVSVVIPAYNAEACLSRAVKSVLAQTMADFEIIIVDDGSCDGTAILAEGLKTLDPRVRFIRNETNKGVSAARNRGFDAARGQWIAVLDGDDAYAPERLERMLAIAEAFGADMVADNLMLYDWIADCAVGPAIGSGAGIRIISISDFFANCITGRSPFDYGQLKFIFRRSYLRTHGLRYIEDLRHGEDFMLYAHGLLAGGRLVLTDEPLYVYTQSVGSLSKTASQMSRTLGHLDDMHIHTIALMAHPGIEANGTLAKLLKRRARAIRWFQSWERVYGYVRTRNVRRILQLSLRDWRISALLAREVIRRALPRLRRPPT